MEILTALADLRDSHKFIYNKEIEFAVGAAVKSMGPEIVLNTIPLQVRNLLMSLIKSQKYPSHFILICFYFQGVNRSWLLPVLKDCISNASLAFFIKSIMPLAIQCE